MLAASVVLAGSVILADAVALVGSVCNKNKIITVDITDIPA